MKNRKAKHKVLGVPSNFGSDCTFKNKMFLSSPRSLCGQFLSALIEISIY